MKRIILSTMLVMLLAFFGSAWIVLNTQWGLDRAYDLVTQSVPGKLSIQSLRGTLRGPIRLFGISYTDDDIDIKLERLKVDWQLINLLTGTLRVSEFNAQDLRIKLPDRFDKPQALVRDDQPDALQTTLLQMPQEVSPTLLVFLRAFANAQDLAITVRTHTYRHQNRDVSNLSAQQRFSHTPSRKT